MHILASGSIPLSNFATDVSHRLKWSSQKGVWEPTEVILLVVLVLLIGAVPSFVAWLAPNLELVAEGNQTRIRRFGGFATAVAIAVIGGLTLSVFYGVAGIHL